MIKNRLFFYIIAGITAFSSGFSADWKDWGVSRGIIVPENAHYAYVMLLPDVYRDASAGLIDLRIADETGETVPYFLQESIVSENSNIIRTECRPISSIQKAKTGLFEFQVLSKRHLAGKVILSINGASYSKKVEIQGREASGDWQTLAVDTVYRLDGYEKNDIILDTVSESPFYRVVMEDNRERLKVSGLTLEYNQNEMEARPFLRTETLSYKTENHDKKTDITIDNPMRLPVEKLMLSITGNFDRSFTLTNSSGDYLLDDKFYRLEFTGVFISNTTAVLASADRSEAFVITIENGDDRPLEVKGVQAVAGMERLVFDASKGKKFTLYYGNPKTEKPAYDIESFRQYVEKEKLAEAVLSMDVQAKPGAAKTGSKPGSWKLFFNILLAVIASGLAVFLIIKLKN